jgi:L-arabinokinase
MVRKHFEASAPGRLDVMGGIGDYSGSLVLQMPISQKTKIELTLRDDYQCRLQSKLSTGETLTAVVDFRDYLNNLEVDYAFARKKFKEFASTHWISYVLGCALVLQKEKGIDFRGGDFTLTSDVPLGKGVSSSASVEVATMKALTEVFDVPLPGTLLPLLAQRVENLIVGAPCGLMDQLASYFGEPKKLLPILCQPDQIDKPIPIPDDISFIGIDSGVRHSVAGASYGDVRCAAFMGYTIIASLLDVTPDELRSAKSKIDFTTLPFQGYLSNISVKQFEESFLHNLPHTLRGNDFLKQHEVSIDLVTMIDDQKNYQVRQCASHPVYEHDRVIQFRNHLLALHESVDKNERVMLLKKMGKLMYQSHESYSLCGLGSERTDEIVSIASKAPGVYGAKITGGGNGGTVCLLVDEEGKKSVYQLQRHLIEKYKADFMLLST